MDLHTGLRREFANQTRKIPCYLCYAYRKTNGGRTVVLFHLRRLHQRKWANYRVETNAGTLQRSGDTVGEKEVNTMEDVKLCPLLRKECQYVGCMLFHKPAAQCSISVIAIEMGSATADSSSIYDSLENISNELRNIATAVKGLV